MTGTAAGADVPSAGVPGFRFAAPAQIIFGAGALSECADLVASLGSHPLLLTGRTPERAEPLLALLTETGPTPITFAVPNEPDVALVRAGTDLARQKGCDCVIAFGGGSVLDAAKAVAVLATNHGDVLDYLEIVGGGETLTQPPLPLLAIPTTAGTGAEATRNSVITSPEHRLKVSLRSPLMLPAIALLDPELTYRLPPALTATTGLDALTQLLEPFVSRRANPLTDGLCREGMGRVSRSLRAAFASASHGNVDPAARQDMSLASLFGGMALANAGLGAVHGLAGPLGGMIDASHGALCAALLPAVVEVNLRALRARRPQDTTLLRYQEAARLLTGDDAAGADDLVPWLRDLVSEFGIARLGQCGLSAEQLPELVQKAQAASSMKGNPIDLTQAELERAVEAAF